MIPIRWARRHLVPLALAVAVGVAGVVFVLVWFEPQQLLVDNTLRDPVPTVAAPSAVNGSSPATTQQPAPVVLARGRLTSGEHHTSGDVRILRLADGRRYVRIESLDTSSGPDVRVYLSAARVGASNATTHDAAHVDLGGLRANHGDQNYLVPRGADLSRFRSLVIWCRRFEVAFGSAELR